MDKKKTIGLVLGIVVLLGFGVILFSSSGESSSEISPQSIKVIEQTSDGRILDHQVVVDSIKSLTASKKALNEFLDSCEAVDSKDDYIMFATLVQTHENDYVNLLTNTSQLIVMLGFQGYAEHPQLGALMEEVGYLLNESSACGESVVERFG